MLIMNRRMKTVECRRQYNFGQMLKAKSKLVEKLKSPNQIAGTGKIQKYPSRSCSQMPSALSYVPHYRGLHSEYASPIKPSFQIKPKIQFTHNKCKSQQISWKGINLNLSKFQKYQSHKICATCEQSNHFRPKLFKKRK